jgi:predicted DNA-binding antitoxin AbrB/MazE fold protein
MSATIEATFDGAVFRPREPVPLAPNTVVRLTIEALSPALEKTASFLQTARSLNLEGPPDWSANLDAYLYGQETERGS